MLNIKDIREKLLHNPIPKEILDIRDNIKNSFSNLEFIESGHKYYLHKADGSKKIMNSVSSVCHRFEPKVDWDSILIKKAEKLGVDPKDLKREWTESNITSTSNGTLTHLFAEGYMHFFMGNEDLIPDVIKKMQYQDGFLIPYGTKQMAVAKYYEDMFNTEGLYPIMPETQVYIDAENNPFGINVDISGTFDALFGFYDKNGDIKLSIRDWKTNKSLLNDYNQTFENTLLEPFNSKEFINQPKSIYTIQLSLYQLGLEQLGYEVKDRKLLWLTDNGEYHKITVDDVTDKLKQALC